MTNLQFLYLSNVTKADFPEVVLLLGACMVATGLTVLQIVPLNLVLMIIVDTEGIVIFFDPIFFLLIRKSIGGFYNNIIT